MLNNIIKALWKCSYIILNADSPKVHFWVFYFTIITFPCLLKDHFTICSPAWYICETKFGTVIIICMDSISVHETVVFLIPRNVLKRRYIYLKTEIQKEVAIIWLRMVFFINIAQENLVTKHSVWQNVTYQVVLFYIIKVLLNFVFNCLYYCIRISFTVMKSIMVIDKSFALDENGMQWIWILAQVVCKMFSLVDIRLPSALAGVVK